MERGGLFASLYISCLLGGVGTMSYGRPLPQTIFLSLSLHFFSLWRCSLFGRRLLLFFSFFLFPFPVLLLILSRIARFSVASLGTVVLRSRLAEI